jgi:formate hydrogenlyase subunit 3/multisubunit Na+/H+ antiporter MnhD subunit
MFLVAVGVIFIGMTTAFFGMAQGVPDKGASKLANRDRWWQIAPPAVLGLLVLWLGLAIPGPLNNVLRQIAATLGDAP